MESDRKTIPDNINAHINQDSLEKANEAKDISKLSMVILREKPLIEILSAKN